MFVNLDTKSKSLNNLLPFLNPQMVSRESNQKNWVCTREGREGRCEVNAYSSGQGLLISAGDIEQNPGPGR